VSCGRYQNRLYDCTKFEKLIRYRCANLFFYCAGPSNYSANRSACRLGRSGRIKRHTYTRTQPIWHEFHSANRLYVLHRNRRDWNTESKSRILARLARANCARSFPSVATSRANKRVGATSARMPFHSGTCRVVGNIKEVHKVAGMRGVRRAVRVAHLLAIAVVRVTNAFPSSSRSWE